MCSRPISIDLKKKKETISRYLSHTPPQSMIEAMLDMQQQAISPQQTAQNIYECMKSTISNRISIYSDNSHRRMWDGNIQDECTEYNTQQNLGINIDIEKKNAIYLYGLIGNKITITSDIAHLTLIDCRDLNIYYVRSPVSGISLMRCININIKHTEEESQLGYLDCEYSSGINIESMLESGFTLYCVGSSELCINKEVLECNVFDQIFGRADDVDISFLLGKSGTGMVYNA